MEIISDQNWGWFEDLNCSIQSDEELSNSLPKPLSLPPNYILESSLSTQCLWYRTAGQRPPQPLVERNSMEALWKENFQNSNIKLSDWDDTSSDESIRVESPGEILYRGRFPFSSSVTKTFMNRAIDTVALQIPIFRVVQRSNGTKYAEFLTIISFGKGTPTHWTFGIWRRHSDFVQFASQIKNIDRSGVLYRNTLLSWQCYLQRKKWFKCLDEGYLALKCCLLERFIQDLLFESPTSEQIFQFLGLDTLTISSLVYST